jgi:hypothetical protein
MEKAVVHIVLDRAHYDVVAYEESRKKKFMPSQSG